ncbi:MAG: hypothetical protein RL518_244 [Pseudomonadota bacterium]
MFVGVIVGVTVGVSVEVLVGVVVGVFVGVLVGVTVGVYVGILSTPVDWLKEIDAYEGLDGVHDQVLLILVMAQLL